MKDEVVSLIIDFPSLPQIKGEFEITKAERLAFYDIIVTTLRYKYNYEKAKSEHKKDLYENQNLDNMRVYSDLLNQVNEKIRDKFAREYILQTIRVIKNNDFKKKSVKTSYETASKWFDPETGIYGKIFRNNLATASSDYRSIDFKLFFEVANREAITENSPWFDDVKAQYEIFKDSYDDLIK